MNWGNPKLYVKNCPKLSILCICNSFLVPNGRIETSTSENDYVENVIT